MGKITNLPKWAQDEIDDRDRKITELERMIDRMAQTEPGAVTAMRSGIPDLSLPDSTRVRFNVPGGSIEAHISSEDKRLHVYAINSSCLLAVLPRASNTVVLDVGSVRH